MYMFSPVLDPGGAVGNQFLAIGLPIIAVAVLAILTVLHSNNNAIDIFLQKVSFHNNYCHNSCNCTYVVLEVHYSICSPNLL